MNKESKQPIIENNPVKVIGKVDEGPIGVIPPGEPVIPPIRPVLPGFIVRGKVQNNDNTPRPGLTVKAFDRNVGADDTLLGQAITDDQGNYFISYTPDQLGGKPSADLVVGVYQNDKPLQGTDVIFNAKPVEEKDFIFAAEKVPEFQLLTNMIQPLLRNKINIAGLEKNQIGFLSNKTGIDASNIDRLAQSNRLSGGNDTLAAFYFGLLSQDFPTDPAALLSRDRASVNRALNRAVSLRLIPALNPQDVDSIMNEELPKLRAKNLLSPAAAGQQASLGDLLRAIPESLQRRIPELLSDDHQRKVADLVAQNGIDYTQLQEQLTKTMGFSQDHAIVIERTLRLGDLTLRNPPLMQHLHGIIGENQDISLKSLANLGRDEWIDKAYAYGVPPGSYMTPDVYAKHLEINMENLHPTAMLAARLNAGDLVIARPGFEKVGTFINNNPDFDILHTNISAFAEKSNLSGVENKDELVKSLLKIQRLKKLSATWDETGALLNNSLDSALDVVNLGQERLLQNMGGQINPERAAIIYQYAKKTHDIGLALMSRVMPRFSPTPVAAMGNATRLDKAMFEKNYLISGGEGGGGSSENDYATIQQLFGPLDYCKCSHDQSVLSPAAYYVDLLQFLKPNKDDPGALGVMLKRRPDLVDLQLSLDNTEIELPYIDLVLEILENAVALPLYVNLPAGTNGEVALGKNPLQPEITDKLQMTALAVIGRDLKATKETQEQGMLTNDMADPWIVSDKQRRWTLYNQAGEGLTIRILDISHYKTQKLRMPLEVDIKELTGELDKGNLSEGIKKQFEAFLQQSIRSHYLFISSYQIISMDPGKEWKIIFRLGVEIVIITMKEQGKLILRTPDGQNVLIRTYSSKAVDATIKGLKEGAIKGLLTAFIDPSGSYQIIPKNSESESENSWSVMLTEPIESVINYEPDRLTINALTYQTVGDTNDLKADPENQNPLAYEKLRAANFPWSLPFNLPLEAVRAYLDRTGITRRQLIELSKPENYVDDTCSVNEVLGISSEEALLMVNSSIVNGDYTKLWQYWGLASDDNGSYSNVSIIDASAGEQDREASGTPLKVLSRVSILMQQARISYDDLMKILQTKYISKNCTITFDNPTECCPCKINILNLYSFSWKDIGNSGNDTEKFNEFLQQEYPICYWRKGTYANDGNTITVVTKNNSLSLIRNDDKVNLEINGKIINEFIGKMENGELKIYLYLNADHLDRIHRFIRLWRMLGWEINELDMAISFGIIRQLDITQDTLISLSHIKRLQELLNLPVKVLIIWCDSSTLLYLPNTFQDQPKSKTLYEQIFLNPHIQSPQDPDFALNSDKSDLLINVNFGARKVTLSEKASLISAALGIHQEDFNQLLAQSKMADSLTLNNLFELYRTAGLVRALGLSVTDFHGVETLMNCIPFENTGAMVKFCQTVKFIQNSGFTVEELAYLLLNELPAGSPLVLSDDQVSQLLSTIRSAMQTKLNAIDHQIREVIKGNPGGVTVKKNLLPEVASDKANLAIGFTIPGDTASNVTGKLNLFPRGPAGTTIIWYSSNSSVINPNDGTVTQPNFPTGDISVTLTAIITKDACSDTKDFQLNVSKKLPPTEAEAVAADKAALAIGFTALNDSASRVTGNLNLPLSCANGSTITIWISSNPSVVSDSSVINKVIGTVTNPDFNEGDASVTLTAVIAKGDSADTKYFLLTIIKSLPTEEQAVVADMAALTIGFTAPNDNASRITGNLILPAGGTNGSKIFWDTNPTDANVVSIDGIVSRPAFVTSDANINLKATIKNGNTKDYKIFNNLIVKKQPQTDVEAVADDKAALTIRFSIPDDDSSNVTGRVFLLRLGPAETKIKWYSSNSSVIKIKLNEGTVTRPSFPTGDIIVTLTAIISKGDSSDTKDFQLNVIKLPQTDIEALEADKSALTIGFTALNDSASRVTGNLNLPISGVNGSTISWISSEPSVVSDSSVVNKVPGTVNRPDFNAGDVDVILKADIRKITSQREIRESRPFNLTVLKLTDADIVAADKAALTIGFKGSDSASGVAGNMTLPPSGGYLFSWNEVSGNDTGRFIDFLKLNHGIDWVKKEDIKISDNNETISVSAGKKSLSLIHDNEKVNLIINGVVIDEFIERMENGEPNIYSGGNHSTIKWYSNNSGVVNPDNGVVTRPDPEKSDISVALIATITQGDAFDIKIFYPQDLLDKSTLDKDRLANVLLDNDLCDKLNNVLLGRDRKQFENIFFLRYQLSDVVLEQAASLFGLELPVIRELLVTDPTQSALLKDPFSTNKDGIEVFFDTPFVSSDARTDPDRMTFSDAYTLIYRLQKTAIILSRLNIKAAEIAWFADPAFDMKCLNFNYLPPETYLFSWDEIPKNDSERFIDFLKYNLGIDWVRKENIKRSDEKTIDISDGTNNLSIVLNDVESTANKANLKAKGTTGVVTDITEFVARMENGELNIYLELFQDWQRLVTLFQIRDSSSKMGGLLAKYIAALRLDSLHVVNVLADGLVFKSDMIQNAAKMLNITMLNITGLVQFRDPFKLKELIDLLYAMKRLGSDADQVEKLTKDWPVPDEATEAERIARSLLRAKYGADSWRDILKPVSNALRVRQRDALVDYLIAQNNMKDANDLYEHYLIDPQMSPCMLTSRLVQATAAVQLFVQRYLLNLEDNVTLNADDPKRWEWMKNYRVWEANRKVFLYPENWLYPELRDDKTQIFTKLQSGIAQGEPNYQLAKENLLVYLDDITDIARITVIGLYEYEDEDNKARTLYVVGRTPDLPYRFYWRKCNNFGEAQMRWSGWEWIEIDASTDHVMPFVMNGELNFAWPMFKKTKDEQSDETKYEQNEYIWEIQLIWISRTSRGWGQKKLSEKSLKSKYLIGIKENRTITFRLEHVNQPLYITDKRVIDNKQVLFHVYGADSKTPTLVSVPNDSLTYIEYHHEPIPSSSTGYFIRPRPEVNAIFVKIFVFKEFDDPNSPITQKVYELVTDAKVYIVPDVEICSFLYGGIIGNSSYSSLSTVSANTYTDGSYSSIIYVGSDSTTGSTYFCCKSFSVNVELPDGVSVKDEKALHKVMTEKENNFIIEAAITIKIPVSGKSETSSPERLLEMKHIGGFVLCPSNDVSTIPGNGMSLDVPFEPEIASSFGNGFRENPYTSQNFFVRMFEFIPNKIGRFLAVPSMKSTKNLSEILYYEENMTKLFIKNELKSDQWRALVDNFEFFVKMRAIAYSDLDSLYFPLILEGKSFNDSGGFKNTYDPKGTLISGKSIIVEKVVFDQPAPSSLYNWEVFYHISMLIAEFLTKQQRFEDAQRWLHYIFNPINPVSEKTKGAAQFWQFLPFREASGGDTLKELFEMLALLTNWNDTDKPSLQNFRSSIKNLEENPFLPHAIARSRQVAYQWRTVFAYLDNLIAWGDQMFRRNTRESINEAIQLYILAAKLLGPRPKSIKPQKQPPNLSFRALYGRWDEFSNAWYFFTDNPQIRSMLDSLAKAIEEPGLKNGLSQAVEDKIQSLSSLGMLYFCIPNNDKLLGYWDTVEDRLFKVRNCMNIDGIVQELPLFAPPIDPELLVRATAAGLDIATILNDLSAPLLPYRFNVLLQKANEICAEVRSLGAALLASLEKEDAEELALKRSTQEVNLLDLITYIKKQQIIEAKANLDVLTQNESVIKARFQQYQKLLGINTVSYDENGMLKLETTSGLQAASSSSGEGAGLALIQYEVDQLTSLDEADKMMKQAGDFNIVSGIFHATPNFSSGTSAFSVSFGGSNLGSALGAIASHFNKQSNSSNQEANKKNLFASYLRRRDEWVHQSTLAMEEQKQIKKQIIAAEIRQAITERELENHQKQIEQAQNLNDFMHEKYTNQELYAWMVGEISGVYFSSYQLSYDLAKRAERAFQSELGVENTSFVNFGYWDSLKKGLLSGESLSLDLKRMEIAYLEQNRRELEITRHISLMQLDPYALLQLRATGSCKLTIPEWVYDMDCPGHYMRRLKTVSLSIPCVTGPYTGVNCTLSLLKSTVRVSPRLKDGKYERSTDEEDDRFRDYYGTIQSVVTSNAQNDSGLFETNLRDERYLPFEMSGAASQWQLKLPSDPSKNEPCQFDYDTISDVILHVRYTARDGGEPLKSGSIKNLQTLIDNAQNVGWVRLFSVRHEFPTEWAKFKGADLSTTPTVGLSLTLLPQHYPFWAQGMLVKGKVKVNDVGLFTEMPPATRNPEVTLYDNPDPSAADIKSDALNQNPTFGNLLSGNLDKIARPAAITDANHPPLTLYFDNNSMEELWIAISWGKD